MKKFYDVKRSIATKWALPLLAVLALSGSVEELQASESKNETTEEVEQASRRTIKGVVVDGDGNALVGVAVIVKGTSYGVSTNSQGEFYIDTTVQRDLTLEFSLLGMKPVEVVVGTRSSITVTMYADTMELENVVVTGYQTLSKERATGSFGTVGNDQLAKPSSSIAERLVGSMSGIAATTNDDGELEFEIRGQSSLNGNTSPLVVVDGFPIQSSMSTINPNDVASITVLKDAAAASIWGAQSANGVIVITTKSGKDLKKGDVKVEFSTFLKYSPKFDYEYYNPVASSAEVIEYETMGFNATGNGYYFGGPWSAPSDSASSISAITSATTALNENRLGYMSDSELAAELARLSSLDNTDQIYDYLIDNPFTQQYNLSITSAGERSTNAVSLLYKDSQGNWQGYDSEKYNFSYRNNTNITKWLDFTFSGNVNYDVSHQNTPYNMGTAPYEMLLNDDGTYNYIDKLYMPNMERYYSDVVFPYDNYGGWNPIEEMNNKDYTTSVLTLRAQAGLTAKIIDGLTASTQFSYEMNSSNTKNITGEGTYAARSMIMNYSFYDSATGILTPNIPAGDYMNLSGTSTNYYNWRTQLSFDKNFDDMKHQITAIAGFEISDKVYQTSSYPTVYGYNDNTLQTGLVSLYDSYYTNYKGSSYTYVSSTTSSFTYSQSRYLSMFANASYTYNEKYTLSASARNDASNLITDDPSYRYSPFWSVGGSWMATNEDFLNNNDWLNRLNVRMTYGYNGNVDTSTSFKPLISIGSSANTYTDEYIASIYSYGNPTLRWEKTATFDFGVDYSMFNGKLYGSVDLYNKKGSDLIVSTAMSSVNGTTSQSINDGEMVNRGIDIEVCTRLRIAKNISFTGGVNFSYNYNEITDMFKTDYSWYELTGGGTSAYMKGQNANSLWAWKYAGLQNFGTSDSPIYQPAVYASADTYQSMAALSWTIDGLEALENMGTTVAPYVYSFNGNFQIYNFNLSFIFTGKFGHVFQGYNFNYPATIGEAPNDLYSTVMASDPSEMVPIPVDGEYKYYYYTNYYVGSLNYEVQSASYLKCQEINVTYTLPKKALTKLGVSGASVYLQGNNLFTIVNNTYNEDPESPIGTIKTQASYTLGINLTL